MQTHSSYHGEKVECNCKVVIVFLLAKCRRRWRCGTQSDRRDQSRPRPGTRRCSTRSSSSSVSIKHLQNCKSIDTLWGVVENHHAIIVLNIHSLFTKGYDYSP